MATTRVEANGAPGFVFTPDGHEGPLPLVLFGHGAHFGKDDPVMQLLCTSLAHAVPAAVLCIDAPEHGERRGADVDDAEFDRRVHAGMSDPATVDRYRDDWIATAHAARAALGAIDDRTAYVGFSMGAVFGFALAGSLDMVGPIVLALGGLRDHGDAIMRAGIERIGDRQVLMVDMTDDEHFPFPGILAAFAALRGPKRMVVYEGGHRDLPPEAIEQIVGFLRTHLRKASS